MLSAFFCSLKQEFAGYNSKKLLADMMAGLTVCAVALPLALAFGADDIDGTIDDTTRIYSMAGAEDRKPSMSIYDMHRIVRAAGYRAVERDTFNNEI